MKTLKFFSLSLLIAVITFCAASTAFAASAYEMNAEAVQLLNKLRKEHGLNVLSWNPNSDLQKAAQLRAREIEEYFSHTRPDGSDCFTVLKQFGLIYHVCGENIAYGTNLSPAGAMRLWTNSPGHYKNMVKPDFREVGLACHVSGDLIYWVQLFYTR